MALINQQQKDKRKRFFFFFWLDFCRERWKKLSAPWVIGHHTLWAMARGAIFILLAPPTTTTTTTFLKETNWDVTRRAGRPRENSKELIDFYKYPPRPAINWNENENIPRHSFPFLRAGRTRAKKCRSKGERRRGKDRSSSSPLSFFSHDSGCADAVWVRGETPIWTYYNMAQNGSLLSTHTQVLFQLLLGVGPPPARNFSRTFFSHQSF